MPKLNQILAIEKGIKTTTNRAITDLHRASEKPDLYEGRYKIYTPSNEDGESLPPETQVVQQTSKEILSKLAGNLAELWNITATKDWTNQHSAHADIVVDGSTLLKNVPVTYLLFLEKQLNDFETVISKMPTLDPSQRWSFDVNQNAYISEKTIQNRTKKVLRNHVLAEATKDHPAQVQVFQEDVVVGRFEIIRQSGALSARDKELLLVRVRTLKAAVLTAREQANLVEAVKESPAEILLSYLIAKV